MDDVYNELLQAHQHLLNARRAWAKVPNTGMVRWSILEADRATIKAIDAVLDELQVQAPKEPAEIVQMVEERRAAA